MKTHVARMLAGTCLTLALGCGPERQPSLSELGQPPVPMFSNGGFESGGGSLNGWTVTTYTNPSGLAVFPPQSVADLNLTSTGGVNITAARTNATPESQLFAGMADAVGLPRWPKFDTTSAVINEAASNSTSVNSLKQAIVLTNADVSPVDNTVHVRFVLAPALQAAGHAPKQQPYFFVILTNVTTNTTLYTNYNYANNPGVPWKSQGSGATAILYTDWTIFDIAPGNVAMKVGDTVQIEIFASRCQPNGHFGEVYVDGFGANFPGLSVVKTAPAASNIDTDITYKFTVENNTAGTAPNVVTTETLPFGTTFVSTTTSTPGASCTGPAVGATGTVSCSFGYMSPSASAKFEVTVHNFAVAAQGSGTASAATTTSLTDASKAWTTNVFSGYSVFITGGTGVGQYRTVLTNTATQLDLSPDWTAVPDASSTYKIVDPPVDRGSTTAATNKTVSDGSKSWDINTWVAYTVTLVSGTGSGQSRTVTGNTGSALTVSPNWTTTPAAGDLFVIGVPPDKLVNGNYAVSADTIARLIGPKVETVLTAGVRYTDLTARISDGVAAVGWGRPVTYTATVTNQGPLAVTGASVTNPLPAQLTGMTWTCSASTGSACAAASGSGAISQTVNLAVGGSATYTISATVMAGSGSGAVTDTFSVAVPAGMVDADPVSNADADTDSIGMVSTVTLSKPAGATGQGQVVSSPAAIACGNACTSQAADFADGTLITLTAIARQGDTFVGWTGPCSDSSQTCTFSASAATPVTATFRGPRIFSSAAPGGTLVCSPVDVPQGGSSVCTVTADADDVLLGLTDGGTEVLGAVVGTRYSLSNIDRDHTLVARFNHRPNFSSSAPPTAATGVSYSYTPVVNDPDGPASPVWSRGPGDTCAGSIDASTGRYSFVGGTASSCVLALQVCDTAAVPACRLQSTAISVNQAPIAVPDPVSVAPNTPLTLLSSALTSNDSPGGPAAEAGQLLLLASVSPSSAQGGTVSFSGGIVTYTPPANFYGVDSFTYVVSDDGTPAASSTGTVTVTVVNQAPTIGSTVVPGATVGQPYVYTATAYDPDGPGASWTVAPDDTCGGSIDPVSGSYTWMPTGWALQASCVLSVQICDGGLPNQCLIQSTPISVTRIPHPPTITSTAPRTAAVGTQGSYAATAAADPAADPSVATPISWSVGPDDSCGTAVDGSSGAVSFTPGPRSPSSCVLSVRACTGPAAEDCITQTQTLSLLQSGTLIPADAPTPPEGTGGAFRDDVGISGGGCQAQGDPLALPLALGGWLLRRWRQRRGAQDRRGLRQSSGCHTAA